MICVRVQHGQPSCSEAAPTDATYWCLACKRADMGVMPQLDWTRGSRLAGYGQPRTPALFATGDHHRYQVVQGPQGWQASQRDRGMSSGYEPIDKPQPKAVQAQRLCQQYEKKVRDGAA